jgi:hypothetical protein
MMGDGLAEPGQLAGHADAGSRLKRTGDERHFERGVLAVLPAFGPTAPAQFIAKRRQYAAGELAARRRQPLVGCRVFTRCREASEAEGREIAPVVVGGGSIAQVAVLLIPANPLAEALSCPTAQGVGHARCRAQPIVAERRVGAERAHAIASIVTDDVWAALAISDHEPIIEQRLQVANGTRRVALVRRGVPEQGVGSERVRPFEALIAGLRRLFERRLGARFGHDERRGL